MYVVHLTEQEAFGIIRSQLERAGLNFGATPPSYVVNYWGDPLSIKLFDDERGVGIAYIRADISDFPFYPHYRQQNELIWGLERRFAEQTTDVIVRVFYNPGLGQDNETRFTRRSLERNLNQQVREFVEFLRAEGIL